MDAQPTRPNPTVPPAPPSTAGVVATAIAVLAALGAAGWLADRQLAAFLTALDEETLSQAARTFDRLLDRQREQLAAEVSVLADDNRIRATVLAPKFDEATVQDVIEDLRRASGATLLAVLDANGRVQVVSGTGALHGADLSASPSVKTAFARPSSDVWTLPDRVQVIGIAAVRSGDQAPALLVKGLPLGKSQLVAVEATLGVAGAIFIGDQIVARSSQTPELDEAFHAASHLAAGTERIATASGLYLARVSRSGTAAMSARIAWIVPYQRHAARARPLRLLAWCPVALGALLFVLLVTNIRRTHGGFA
jgi:hypothetical protein